MDERERLSDADTRLDMGRVTMVYERALTAAAISGKARTTARMALFFALLAIGVVAADIAIRLHIF